MSHYNPQNYIIYLHNYFLQKMTPLFHHATKNADANSDSACGDVLKNSLT